MLSVLVVSLRMISVLVVEEEEEVDDVAVLVVGSAGVCTITSTAAASSCCCSCSPSSCCPFAPSLAAAASGVGDWFRRDSGTDLEERRWVGDDDVDDASDDDDAEVEALSSFFLSRGLSVRSPLRVMLAFSLLVIAVLVTVLSSALTSTLGGMCTKYFLSCSSMYASVVVSRGLLSTISR
jgi:hypothetical protein